MVSADEDGFFIMDEAIGINEKVWDKEIKGLKKWIQMVSADEDGFFIMDEAIGINEKVWDKEIKGLKKWIQ